MASIDDRILKLLANQAHRSFRRKEIAKRLDVSGTTEYRRLQSTLTNLLKEGRVADVKGGRIQHKRDGVGRSGATRTGRLATNSRGFGFVRVDGLDDDVFVAASNMGTALDGDLVRLEILARSRNRSDGRSAEGKIVEVIERERTEAVGTYRTHGRLGFVVPDDRRLTRDVYVEEAAGATQGDKVVVSIDRFDHPRGSPEGRVLNIIGPETDPRVRVSSIALSLGVRLEYPEDADRAAEEAAARGRPIPDREIARRVDLRSRATVTIDPADAKDFDDAIHVEPAEDGGIRVGVHVADVAHYVDADTVLDREAYLRGTSAYLVDRVVPMLPEVLSAEVCSLRPGEDKLALSVLIDLDADSRPRATRVVESVIRSDHRLSYEEAQQIIEGRDHPDAGMITAAARVARALRSDRMKNGSIEFDLPEVRVELDEAGRPVDIRPRERFEAHRLIEEFMLLANRTVATWMSDRAFVYRVHASPDADRLAQLAGYVSVFGFDLALSDGFASPNQINKLLSQIRDMPQEAVIQNALLRAMAKAEYAVENIGHYGLAITDYTHFTSPIRRYPDLIVHRLVKTRLRAERDAGDLDAGAAPAELKEASRHCSERERVAVDAERASVKLKQVEYALDHVGDQFRGVISGVSPFGVFVQLSDLLVEGLVHVRDMEDDFYEYDESTYSLVGTHHGRVFQVGREATVVIVRADTESREIDLFFADEPSGKES